jgi:tetratricopeptide (TPR) repeat protein
MNQQFETAKEHFESGLHHFKNARYKSAKVEFFKAYELMPERPSVLSNLSATLIKLKEWPEAQRICKQLVKIDPQDSIGWMNLGICAAHDGQYKIAQKHFSIATDLNSSSFEVWANKGHVHQELAEFLDANNCYLKALELNPKHEDALIGLGNLLNEQKNYQDALKYFDAVIFINPENYLAKWNKALSLLRLGNFTEGWRLFESRQYVDGMMEHRPKLIAPLWLGLEPIHNKIIYVHAEQGYGDTIQFSRYIPILEKEKKAKVILGAPKPLIELMKTLGPEIEVVDQDTFSEENYTQKIDYQTPIMSLALAFNTQINSIPVGVPYLNVDDRKITKWTKILKNVQQKKSFLRVGITWRGSGKYANKASEKRNLPFSYIAELVKEFAPNGIEFHAIQTEFGADTDFKEPHIEGLYSHSKELVDFSDTAALIAQLDLIIAVDTAAAHLSGALAKDTFLLLPDPPDFMSLIHRNDSPWYPNTKLIRQPNSGNWTMVMNTVGHELTKILLSHSDRNQ